MPGMTVSTNVPSVEDILGWFSSLSNWGRWGTDDALGTLNLITEAKRAAAAQLVRDGIVVSCARTITYEPTPDNTAPARHFMLRTGEGQQSQPIGRGGSADACLLAPHGISMTHLDAPAHSFVRTDPSQPWTMFNGLPATLVTAQDGATAGSIELAGGGIVSR